ncbi:MAG: hypothetical protein IKF90_06830 [Parasporobacterium sp.]|nr:hypothetical protein [Parasporobacterium sp.]
MGEGRDSRHLTKPQMALYEKVSAQIYSIYLWYVSTCDIHGEQNHTR